MQRCRKIAGTLSQSHSGQEPTQRVAHHRVRAGGASLDKVLPHPMDDPGKRLYCCHVAQQPNGVTCPPNLARKSDHGKSGAAHSMDEKHLHSEVSSVIVMQL